MHNINSTKTRSFQHLFLLIFILSAGTLFSQSNTGKTRQSHSFPSSNNVSTYSEDINAISQILNTGDATQVNAAKIKLKEYYLEMSNNSIDDTMLNIMMDGTQGNYDVWMAVYNDVKANHSEADLYVLRSIITNIKMKL